MEKTNDLDSLLNGCESAKIFFASLPDYVRGAVIKNSAEIKKPAIVVTIPIEEFTD